MSGRPPAPRSQTRRSVSGPTYPESRPSRRSSAAPVRSRRCRGRNRAQDSGAPYPHRSSAAAARNRERRDRRILLGAELHSARPAARAGAPNESHASASRTSRQGPPGASTHTAAPRPDSVSPRATPDKSPPPGSPKSKTKSRTSPSTTAPPRPPPTASCCRERYTSVPKLIARAISQPSARRERRRQPHRGRLREKQPLHPRSAAPNAFSTPISRRRSRIAITSVLTIPSEATTSAARRKSSSSRSNTANTSRRLASRPKRKSAETHLLDRVFHGLHVRRALHAHGQVVVRFLR